MLGAGRQHITCMTSFLLKLLLWLSFVQFSWAVKAMLLLHNLVRPIKKKLFIFRCHDRNWELRATFASCQVMLYKVGLSCCRLSRPNRSRVEDEIRLLSLVLRAEIIWKIQLLFSHSCSVCLDKGPEGPWVFAPINTRLLFVWFFFPVLIFNSWP